VLQRVAACCNMSNTSNTCHGQREVVYHGAIDSPHIQSRDIAQIEPPPTEFVTESS